MADIKLSEAQWGTTYLCNHGEISLALNRNILKFLAKYFLYLLADIVVRGTMSPLDISIYQFPRLLLHPFDRIINIESNIVVIIRVFSIYFKTRCLGAQTSKASWIRLTPSGHWVYVIRGYPERDTEEEEGHLKGRFVCPKVSTSTIFNQWGKRYISTTLFGPDVHLGRRQRLRRP